MREGRRRWLGGILCGLLLTTGACAATPKSPSTAEIAPLRVRHAQTGANERCGTELIRAVQRANDLTWPERLFFGRTAQREAGEAVQDEERWRRQCVERYRQRGYEIVGTSPAR